MEPPECPVCLQPFDGESTVPRVLACGHSACDSCLIDLPKPPFPRTIRCPACTQLVTYPHPQGPSALPKNIDLLRISSSLLRSNSNSNSNSNPKPKPTDKTSIVSFPDFIPHLWSHEFYYNWKELIVPQDSISVDASAPLDRSLLHGRVINSKAPTRCSMKRNQEVSLYKVGSFIHHSDSNVHIFKYSYLAKIMWILFQMRDVALAELELILTSSLKEYRICKAYGLWYNVEDEHLYLVCESNHTTLVNVIVSDNEEDISRFAMMGMELCESVIRLHDMDLVAGCASFSCFNIDDFGHILIDLNEVLMVGERVQQVITETISFARKNDDKRLELDLSNGFLGIHAFPSPEVLVKLVEKEGILLEFGMSACSYSSDVWSIACILLWLLVGKSFLEETHEFLSSYILTLINGNHFDSEGLFVAWLDKIFGFLDSRLGSNYVSMKDLLRKCLCSDPGTRPVLCDVWKCMRKLVIKSNFDLIGSTVENKTKLSTCHCLLLGDLLWSLKKTFIADEKNGTVNERKAENLVVESDVIEGIRNNSLKCADLKGHIDCISGLAIGGGFLFSSSFDKTVNVWSLQDLNHVNTFKGHEHKVMAVAFLDSEPPLCISGDNGGDIFLWLIKFPFDEKPIKRLNEGKDWRFSGIHALAVYGSRFFYTGSGDKTIKAWSMHDYNLLCTLTGHKSVVSALEVCNEVLYSGSWDGTIRLWCLSDHSPLAVFGEEAPGASVLSLTSHTHTLVAAHENGCIKIWNKDTPLKTMSAHSSSIFSVYMEGQWLFSGGWNKTVVVQKLSGDDEAQIEVSEIGSIAGDSVVTALLYWQGRLFVGHADRLIKVYSF